VTYDTLADLFPLADPNPVRCGNRTDLPKKDRKHHYVCLGPDARHADSGEFREMWVRACTVCGMDKVQSKPPASCADGCTCTA
jgi:hypothetical protein